MKEIHDVILRFLQTEKGTSQVPMGKYFFQVAMETNKVAIKKAVEELYKVHVTKVNTTKVPGRWKRVRTVAGKTPDWKKAIVTLRSGEKIEVS